MTRTTKTAAVTAAVMLATSLAALDTTVVGTAMPTIIGSLGGLSLYSWVFSAYLLTSTTTVPLYGRLADVYGRKPVLLVGTIMFLCGSALSGAAGSMEQLIIFRALQGLGAGAVLPVATTVVGDIFTIEKRAKIQGLLSSVWGISAIVGPALGGLIVDNVGWRWVFYVNLPFGLLAIVAFWLFLHETAPRGRRSIDYAGAFGLTVALTLVLLGALASGESAGSLVASPWALLGSGGLLTGLVIWGQTRAAEPLLPLPLLRRPVLAVSYAASLLSGATMLCFSSYIPPFVQGVLGGSAISAGAALAPMSIGWPVGSILSGRLILRYGYRPIVLLGTACIFVGALGTTVLGLSSTQAYVMTVMAIVGLGMGLTATSFIVAVQSSVGWSERGIGTAFVQFSRSIGGALGVAAVGAILNSHLNDGLSALGLSTIGSLSSILEPAARASLSPEALTAMSALFADSLHAAYLAVAIGAAATVVLAGFFPGGSVADHAREARRLNPDG